MLRSIIFLTAFVCSIRSFSYQLGVDGSNRFASRSSSTIGFRNNVINSKYRIKSTVHYDTPVVPWGDGLSQEDLMNKEKSLREETDQNHVKEIFNSINANGGTGGIVFKGISGGGLGGPGGTGGAGTASLRIAGKLPCISQAIKKGFQSI